eukprot:scaffold46311_cov18-Tisochrysis_lutea.AAC.1
MLAQSLNGSALAHSPRPSVLPLTKVHQSWPVVQHPRSLRQCQQTQLAAEASICASIESSTASPSSNSSPINHQHQHFSPPSPLQPKSSRRVSLLAAAGVLLCARPLYARADPEQATSSMVAESPGPEPLPPLADRPEASGKQLLQDPKEFTYAFESEVPCDLRVKQYYEIIVKNRPRCWQRIASQIQASNFTGRYGVLAGCCHLKALVGNNQGIEQ